MANPPGGPKRWLDRLGLGRRAPDEEVDWEIEHHLAEFTDRLLDDGWTPASARAEAERRFGDARRYGRRMKRIERGRRVMRKGSRWGDLLVEGLRSFARTSRRYPGFTLGVVATLGLGIGANATMYGIIDRLLLQPPLHVTSPDRVKVVHGHRPSAMTGEFVYQTSFTYPDYEGLRGHSGMHVGGFTTAAPITVGEGEAAGPVPTALATASFFEVTGVRPRMGRFFTPGESAEEAPLTAVISEDYWDRAWGRDPGAVGSTLLVQGVPATIIGVTPAGFTGVGLAPVDLWLPLEPTHVLQNGGTDCMRSIGCWWLRIAARLGEQTTVQAAEAEATALHRNTHRERISRGQFPDNAAIALTPLIAAQGPNPTAETGVARWLAWVSALVLLIACANVTNLLLARSTRQSRETGVRLALGASRQRVVAATMIESVALALMGGALALAIARFGGARIRDALLPGVHFPHESWSLRLVAFTLLVAVLAGLVSGLPPALQGRRTELTHTLGCGSRGSSGRRSRLRSGLTVAQGALSVVLLVGAGLFLRSLSQVRALDLGLDVDELLIVHPELTNPAMSLEERVATFDEIQRQLASMADVRSSTTTAVPFQWAFATDFEIPGVDSIPRLPGGGPYVFQVSDDYFRTTGIRIDEGRGFDPTDDASGDRVVIVSRTMAESIWPRRGAIGQCMLIGDDAPCTTVVGIAEDAARSGYQDDPFMAYYLPLSQTSSPPRALYVRTRGAADRVAPQVASALRSSVSGVRYFDTRPFREMLDPQARSWALGSTMFSIFGLIALVLAAIGLHGVLSFDVAQKRRELGIRTALGASQARLLGSVVARGSLLAGAGIALGSVVSWLAAPLAADLLFEVSPRDPGVLVAVAAVLFVVCVLASLIPGLRATGVEPVEALAAE